ncbi:MAG: hypothetical protein JWM10_4389, partial [Myxococcaceae bacterium]|nr:hypothetical protein [Myxococcaceae bacterium]
SVHLVGPLWLYLALPARLVVQLPLVLLALDGARAREAPPALRRALLATFAAGLALYTLATGAAHVARLTQWLWAALVPFAAVGLTRQLALAAAGDRRRGRLVAVALMAHVAVAGAETVARWRSASQGSGGPDRATLLRGIDRRRAGTDRLLRALHRDGCGPADGPPEVALVEVQRRLTLDGRVAIVSLDGVTAPSRGGVTFDPATGCPRLDAVLARPSLWAVLEDPRAQLGACVTPAVARALPPPSATAAGFGTGWTWDAALHGWRRPCHRVDQSPPRAASSSASASPTVASRTAARPTSP